MAEKTDTKCVIVRDGVEIAFRMPVERLLQLTAVNRTYEIVDGDAYISDVIASLNRGYYRSEIEALLVAEMEHVHEMGSESVRHSGDIDDEPSAPSP